MKVHRVSSRAGRIVTVLLLLLGTANTLPADETIALVPDRIAIERVYYSHRLGAKPPFEQVMPPDLAAKLVRQDLHKEAVLKRAYRVEITPAMLDAEVQRINSTTRAPDVLAELKAALGNNPARFALTVAKPILVERTLRARFDNDDQLHSAARRQTETVRERLLSARRDGISPEFLLKLLQQDAKLQVTENRLRLGARPAEKSPAPVLDELEAVKRFGPDSKLIAPSKNDPNADLYFEDLPARLQQVLQAQLLRPGDLSAVIEMPNTFLLYLCKDKTAEHLAVAVLSVPKRNYEQWLNEQSETK